jgi:hypothetical protein
VSRLPSKLPAAQACMDLATEEDRDREREALRAERRRQHLLKSDLWNAMKAAIVAMGGEKIVAGRLDDIWGKDINDESTGVSVGESKLHACMGGTNYNKPSVEWLFELALDARVAEVLLRVVDGKGEIDPDEELENVYEIAAEEFLAPKQVAKLKQMARARRRKR